MLRAFLICLACCCSSFTPLKHSESIVNDEQSLVIEKKVKNNYVRIPSGYYRFGLTDLLSTDFLGGLLDYYVYNLGVEDMKPSSTNPVNNYAISTNSDNHKVFIFNDTGSYYFDAYSVSFFVMNKTIRDGEVDVANYNFIISNHSPYDQQISINFYAQESSSLRGYIIWGCGVSLPRDDIRIYNDNTLVTSIGLSSIYRGFMLQEKEGGTNAFISTILNSIKGDPYNNGYNTGYNQGFENGVSSVVDNPDSNSYQTIYNNGYQNGYTNGYTEALDTDSTALTIFTGFVNVGLLPVNVLLQMFNYEVFGINIAGLLSSIITIAIVVIIIRVVTGKKND